VFKIKTSASPVEELRTSADRERNPLKRHILEAMADGLRAADPGTLLRHTVQVRGHYLTTGRKKFNLSRYNRVLVLGGGKAAAGMAQAIESMLDNWITAGIVNVPYNPKPRVIGSRILLQRASHPYPNNSGRKGVEKMLQMVGRPTPKDLVICLLSGGASALMPMPLEGLGLGDLRETTQHLLRSGASIREVNVVRKHLSGLTGGRLAQRLYPATILSLIISDVVGDDVGSIASGPTSPDESTFADARRVLERYDLKNRVPPNVRRIIERGTEGAVTDTPKPSSKIFNRVHNLVVGNNRDCCEAAANSLRKQGYRTIILSTKLEGEARQVGLVLARILLDLDGTRFSFGRPLAIVAGGETTVTVKGPGLGGRNHELVLSAALEIQGLEDVALGSMDTDGIDGSTPVAGTLADGNTIKQGLTLGLDGRASLERNDSYNFFKKVKGLIITGRTGTNVNDLIVAVAGSPPDRESPGHVYSSSND